MKTWSLSSSAFSLLDKLKVAKYILCNNQLTMGPKTAEFEKQMAQLAGVPFAVATSSGSTSNQLLFELYKQELKFDIKDVVVLVPTTTWISSLSPAIMAGFQIEFCDVNLCDFSFDYVSLEKQTQYWNSLGKKVIIFATALVGYNPDFKKLRKIATKYSAEFWLDSCENTLSLLPNKESVLGQCRFTTTSCYFSHEIQSIEMGFVFCKDGLDYEKLLMIRCHGLSRALPKDSLQRFLIEKENQDIDPQFLFETEGSNFRPSDQHAIWGLLDFKRKDKYFNHRREIYQYFYYNLNLKKYFLPRPFIGNQENMVPFCLPIFSLNKDIKLIKNELNNQNIECRPLISGNLKRHPVFRDKPYILNPRSPESYPNSEFIHNRGLYVGLNSSITKKHIDKLIKILHSI